MKADDVLLRFVIQRASQAEVVIEGQSQGCMGTGLVILFGVGRNAEATVEAGAFDLSELGKSLRPILEKTAEKIIGLRIFQDENQKMNLSVKDIGGGIYFISQFTLFADCKKGFRPGFSNAAPPQLAEKVYEDFIKILKEKGPDVSLFTGNFGADMKVSFTNDGPVTVLLEADVKGLK